MKTLFSILAYLVTLTTYGQYRPTPYDTNTDAVARSFVASQIGSQVAGSNFLNSQQVGTQVGGSNYTTSLQIAASNYVTSLQIAGSNYLNATQVGTQIGGSNYTTRLQIAGSNYVTSSQIAGSNYVTSSQIAGSNYTTSGQISGSNFLTGNVRQKLTNTLNLFVATTGNDSNAGTNASSPLLTIQRGVDIACLYDFGTNNAVIQVSNGVYSGSVLVNKMVANTDWKQNQGILFIHGNDASPTSVTITNATTNHLVMASQGASVVLGSLCVGATNVANLNLLDAQLFSTLAVSNIVIGPTTNGAPQIVSESFGHFYTQGPVTVASGSGELVAVLGPADAWLTQAITFSGSPAYSTATLFAQGAGTIYIAGASFSGVVTGSRYALFNGASINTLGGTTADALAIGNSPGSSGLGLVQGATNIYFGNYQLSTVGPVGIVNADNGTAGIVGEFTNRLLAVGSALPLLTGVQTNVLSITLAAGDWDVEGCVIFAGASATATRNQAAITTTSGVLPADGSQCYSALNMTTTSFTDSVTVPRQRVNVNSATPVYLIGQANFSAGSMTAYGQISARRVR